MFLFTKPVVTLLARTKFFGGGHKLSGLDAAHLGRSVAYAGRGRVRTPPGRAAVDAAATADAHARRAPGERKARPGTRHRPSDRVEQTTTSGRES